MLNWSRSRKRSCALKAGMAGAAGQQASRGPHSMIVGKRDPLYEQWPRADREILEDTAMGCTRRHRFEPDADHRPIHGK
jgi:hypothetical protein